MILRKPYAFFIKHFKLLHVILVFLSAYLAFKTLNLSMFFSDYGKAMQIISNFEMGEYINVYLFLINMLIIILNIIILSVMIVKKKPFVQYVYSLLVYSLTFVMFLFAFSSLRVVNANILNATIVILLRDFLMICALLQMVSLILYLIRSTGFDIKKFDFGADLEQLKISDEDSEEVEAVIEFDKNILDRSFKEKLRYAKYAIVENKNFVIVLFVILVLIIGVILYFNIFIYRYNVKEGVSFSASGITMSVEDTFVTTQNYRHKQITKDDKALVILRTNIKANNKSILEFNTGLATLQIGKYKFDVSRNYNTYISDLGKVYFSQKLDTIEQSYLLVYEIPKGLQNEQMTLKFNDNISYIGGELGAKNVYVKLKPVNLDKTKLSGTKKLGQALELNDTVLGNAYLKIDSYEIKDSFKVSYKYCVSTNNCIDSIENITPTASSNYEKVIMKLVGTYESDDSLSSSVTNLYNFVSLGTLIYTIDGKEYKSNVPIKEIKPSKTSSKHIYYVEVEKNTLKANGLYFDFKVRNKEYKYILKEEV